MLLFCSLAAVAQEAGPIADPPDPLLSEPALPVDTIQITGNTLLPEALLREIVAPFEGRTLDFKELQAIAQLVEKAYRDAGYILVKAILPEQEASAGLVEIQILEGLVGNITVEGNHRYPTDFIKGRFLAAVPEKGLRAEDFTRSLFLLNEMPDLRLKAVLRAGEAPNSTDIVLQAEEDRNYHFGLEYNNFGTPVTGEHRAGFYGDFSSVGTAGDTLLLRGVFGIPSEGTTFFQGSYTLPITPYGTRLGMHYANGNYTAGQEVAILDIRGEADILTMSVEHPLHRSLTYSSDLSLQLSYNDVNNTLLGLPFSNDVYTAARLGMRNEWRDTKGRYLMGGSISKGLGGHRKGDPRSSRLGAGADFTKFNLDLARVQEFDDSVIGILRGNLQVTGEPLFAAEQFALGGPDTVRGFSQAEILGDQAYNMTAELRWSPIPDEIDLFQTVFFVDHGAIVRKRPQPGELGSEKLTGAGFGFRVNYEQTRVRLDFGFPISPSSNIRGTSPAVYGQIQTRF